MSEDRENSSGFFSGLVLGGLAGASAFFLLGTKQGRKIKKILLKEGEKFLAELENLDQNFEKEKVKKTQEIKKLKKATTTKIEKVKQVIPQRFFRRNGQQLKQ